MADTQEFLEEVLSAVYLAGTENGLGREIRDSEEIQHRKEAFIKGNAVSRDSKQAILQHFQQEQERDIPTYLARNSYDIDGKTKQKVYDELDKIVGKGRTDDVNHTPKLYTQSEVDRLIREAREEGAKQFKDHLALTDLIMYGDNYQEWLEKEWGKNQSFLGLSKHKEGSK